MSGCLMVFDSHFANWTSVYTCVYCILKRRPLCTLQVSTTRWSVAMWACGLLADIGVGGTPHPRRRKLWFEHDHLLFLNFNWFDMDLKDCPCMVTQTSFTGLRKILKITGPWQVCCAFKRAIQIQDCITLHYCVWHNSGPDVLPRLFSPEVYELFEIFKFIDAF